MTLLSDYQEYFNLALDQEEEIHYLEDELERTKRQINVSCLINVQKISLSINWLINWSINDLPGYVIVFNGRYDINNIAMKAAPDVYPWHHRSDQKIIEP